MSLRPLGQKLLGLQPTHLSIWATQLSDLGKTNQRRSGLLPWTPGAGTQELLLIALSHALSQCLRCSCRRSTLLCLVALYALTKTQEAKPTKKISFYVVLLSLLRLRLRIFNFAIKFYVYLRSARSCELRRSLYQCDEIYSLNLTPLSFVVSCS